MVARLLLGVARECGNGDAADQPGEDDQRSFLHYTTSLWLGLTTERRARLASGEFGRLFHDAPSPGGVPPKIAP